jgi:sugar O-acyltransferase (sialic acid O-acetyltransferase NeuD family)
MSQPLVLLGGGGELPQYLEALELTAQRGGPRFDLVGILDDNPALQGRSVHSLPVLGPLSRAADWPEARLLWGLGSLRYPTGRLSVFHRLGLPLARYLTLVHPDAFVSPKAAIAPGVTILAGSRVTAGARLAPHSSLGFHCLVEHDSEIGPGTLFSGGCIVAGHVRIGAGCFLGQGCNIKDGARIGHCATVGMGTVVLHDIEDGQIVVGNPGRVLRTASLPPELPQWLAGLNDAASRIG